MFFSSLYKMWRTQICGDISFHILPWSVYYVRGHNKTKNRPLYLFYTDCINPDSVAIRPSLYEIFVISFFYGLLSHGHLFHISVFFYLCESQMWIRLLIAVNVLFLSVQNVEDTDLWGYFCVLPSNPCPIITSYSDPCPSKALSPLLCVLWCHTQIYVLSKPYLLRSVSDTDLREGHRSEAAHGFESYICVFSFFSMKHPFQRSYIQSSQPRSYLYDTLPPPIPKVPLLISKCMKWFLY
jgi:hypothetical protein